jgi:hypothetical protein
MTKENTLSIELISGVYSSILWEGIESVFYDDESLINIHDALETLYDNKNSKEAFGLVCALFSDFQRVLQCLLSATKLTISLKIYFRSDVVKVFCPISKKSFPEHKKRPKRLVIALSSE